MKRLEITREHLEALADILAHSLADGKKYDYHIGALMLFLSDKQDVAKVISIALQKLGLKHSIAAGNIANSITKGEAIPLLFFKSEVEEIDL